MLGLWLGGGVDEGSELLVWVRAVATAILAGVIAQILVQPPGRAWRACWIGCYGAVAAGSAAFIARGDRFCRRGLWRTCDACWQMVARLIGVRQFERTGENGMNSLARSAFNFLSCDPGGGCRYAAECKSAAGFRRVRSSSLPSPYAAGGLQPTSSGVWSVSISAGLEASGHRREQGARKGASAPKRWRVLSPTATRFVTAGLRSSCSIRCCTRSCPTTR